jgi:hypothetical protein
LIDYSWGFLFVVLFVLYCFYLPRHVTSRHVTYLVSSPAVKFVRGGEILEVRDGNNNVVSTGANTSTSSYISGDGDGDGDNKADADADFEAVPYKGARR